MTAAPVAVLLVDDDPEDQAITRELLEEIGQERFVVDSVHDFTAAAEIISAGRAYDVCFLDYALGGRNGLDLLRLAVEAAWEVPIVLLTGRSDHGVERAALADGAADYLIKGHISPETLERSIRHSVARGRTLAALKERERLFRAVFDSALDGMVIVDDEARYDDANPAALAMLGVTRQQLLRRSISDFGQPSDAAAAASAWQTFLREGRHEGEVQIVRSDGEVRTLEVRSTAHILRGRHLSVMRDVTERRRTDRMRGLLAAIVESCGEAIVSTSLDGRIDYWSPSAERMFGFTAAEMIGQPQAALLPPDRAGELEASMRRIEGGESLQGVETVHTRKDGSRFEAVLTVSPIRMQGQIVGTSFITRDISEKTRLEARLMVADRMASVGTLAAGVAHEINNPLTSVMGNLEVLADAMSRGKVSAKVAALRGPLDDARLAAERISMIVRDLKLFSRPDDRRSEIVDVTKVLESSVRMAWNEIRHRARLVRKYHDVPPVDGNAARLGQVFLNLIVNAAQAIAEGNADHHEIRVETVVDALGRVIVEVSDTGRGIPPETLPHIFDPFFTTKPVGVGTGLGLSICQRIVTELGGTIEAENAPGGGATFRVTLAPARDLFATEAVAAPAPTPTPALRRGQILVVDDDTLTARAIVRTLSDDHDIVAVSTAQQALERLAAGDRYDVVLCDLMMPQMTGMDLHGVFVKVAPDQAARMVFMTGGAFTQRARAFLEEVPNVCVEKPFSAVNLRSLINDRLR